MTAIQATLEDYKRIKTRNSWQIILEVKTSEFPKVLATLGNPDSGESIWVGVARIHPEVAQENQLAAESHTEEEDAYPQP